MTPTQQNHIIAQWAKAKAGYAMEAYFAAYALYGEVKLLFIKDANDGVEMTEAQETAFFDKMFPVCVSVALDEIKRGERLRDNEDGTRQ